MSFSKFFTNCYLRLLFKPYLAEHFRFMVTNGFLVVYIKPRFGLKLKKQVLVSSYFGQQDEDITLGIIDDLRRRRIRVTQRTFETTRQFIEVAKKHLVLKSNSWVQAEYDEEEVEGLINQIRSYI